MLQQSEENNKEKAAIIQALEKKLDDAMGTAKMLDDKVRQGETIRRKLHNAILELKGNIRVFCRVRPLLGIYHLY